MDEPREILILRDPERVALVMDPARRQVVEALAAGPDSAVGLARRLDDSRQRLNYHLRLLEDAGLIELAEERPRRGVTERVMRLVARRFVVAPAELGGPAGAEEREAASGDRFSATYLLALASRSIRELADLLDRARSSGKRLVTAGVSAEVRLAEPSQIEAFVEDLTRAVGEVIAKHQSEAPGGRTFRLTAGFYPKPVPGGSGSETEVADG